MKNICGDTAKKTIIGMNKKKLAPQKRTQNFISSSARKFRQAYEARQRLQREQDHLEYLNFNKLQRLNHLYATLSQINQTIMHVRDRDSLFREICRVVIDYGRFKMAWIGLMDESSKLIIPEVFAGEEQGYLRNLSITYLKEVLGNGPTGRAIREERCIIAQDIAHDPRMEPWRDQALRCGFLSSAAVPIRYHNRVFGTLTVYAAAPFEFDLDNEYLLGQIGQNISFALDQLQNEDERKAVEEELRKNETLYRSLFENMLNGFAYCHMLYENDIPQDFIYLNVNRKFEDLTGLKNVTGKRVSEVIPGIRESDAELFDTYSRVAMTGNPEEFEMYIKSLKDWYSVLVYSPEKSYFVAVFEVITRRKLVVEALRESEERYRQIVDTAQEGIWLLDAERNITYANQRMLDILGYSLDEMIGTSFNRFIDDQAKKEAEIHFKRRQQGIKEQYDFCFRRKDGTIIWAIVSASPLLSDDGNVVGSLGLITDITLRKQAEEDIRSHVARVEALVRTAARLNAQLDMDTLLRIVCQEAASALNSPAAWINLYDPKQDILCFASDYGMPPEFKKGYQPLPRGVYNELNIQMSSINVFSDVQMLMDRPNWKVFSSLNICTVAGGSMWRDEQLIGTLSVISYGEVRDFSQDELTFLQGLTDQAALAIVNIRLFEQVSAGRQRLQVLSKTLIEVQEKERRSLALELHDELGQMLSAVRISLHMIPNLPQAEAKEQLQEARTLVSDLLIRVRRMSLDLRPSMLDDLGLLPALYYLFKNYQAQTRETVSFEHSGLERRFTPEVEITAFRIIQEGLTNVMRHAVNKQVIVNVWADEQSLNMQMRDFGVGFDPAVVHSKGVSSGLSGMRERTRLLGGEMVIESTPGKGTILTVRLLLV
jgi:PAS domain S-box-containing protein